MNSSTLANAGKTLKNDFQVKPLFITIKHFNLGKSSFLSDNIIVYSLPIN